MEHYLTAGIRDIDGLLSTKEKRGEPGRRRQHIVVGCTELLDIPLGVKIPLLPGSNPVFYRTKLGEKLHQPSGYFALGDPHCRLLSNEYNSLHDPHLQAYYQRKDNLRRLKKGGYVTSDGKVVCTLRQFNEYRQYLTMLKTEAGKMYCQEQKMLRRHMAKLKDAPELPEGMDISRLREWLLREQRESLRDGEREMRDRFLAMIAQRMEKLEALKEEKHLLHQAEREQRELGKKRRSGTQNSSAEQTSQSSADGKKNRRPLRASVVSQENLEVMATATCQSTTSQEKDAAQTAVKGRPEEETLSSSKLLSSQEPSCQELQSPEDSLSELSQEDPDTENQESSTEDSSRQLSPCPETRTSLSSGSSEEVDDSDLKESRRFLQKSLDEELHNKVQTRLLWTTLTEAQELEEVAESVVEEVLERVKDMDPLVCVLRTAPLAIGGRLFGSARKAKSSETSAPDLQQEIGVAASEIVATIIDSFGKHLVCSTTDTSDPRLSARWREHLIARGAMRAGKMGKSGVRQAELPGFDGTAHLASLDKTAKDVVEQVGSTLQSFVASQFEQYFHCKFSEILKLPVKTISKRQSQPSWTPFSTQVTKEVEESSRASEHWAPETMKKRKTAMLGAFHNVAAVSQESHMLARGSIQNAISKVQQLHSELKVYAKIVVHDVLETLKKQKKKLDKEMLPKDSSEESSVESGLVESLLDQCGQHQTSMDLGVNCGKQIAKQPSPRDEDESYLEQYFQMPGGMKIPARKLEESQLRTNLSPISLPGMVMPSEAEAPLEEELSRNLVLSVLRDSEQDAQSPAEDIQKPLYYPLAHTSRLYTPIQETLPKPPPGSMQDAFPSMGQQFSRQPTPPPAPKPPSQRGARWRPMHVKLMSSKPEQWESGEMALAGRLVEGVLRRCMAPGSSSSSDTSAEN